MKNKRANRIIAFLTVALLTVCAVPSAAFADTSGDADARAIEALTLEPERGTEYDGYIVVLKDGKTDDLDLSESSNDVNLSPEGDLLLVDDPADVLDVAAPEIVKAIVPNVEIEALGNPPNDTYWGSEWHLRSPDAPGGYTAKYGIDATALYTRSLNGTGVSVGVFDTGLYDHRDFRKNFTSQGINFDSLSKGTFSRNVTDLMGHGTHVSGIIAAYTNNGTDLAALTDNVDLRPYRVFDDSNICNLYTLFVGLQYLRDTNQVPDVINMSLGAENLPALTLSLFKSQIDATANAGAIIVAAAGNSGTSSGDTESLSYPASFDSVISVASNVPGGILAEYSSENNKVDVTAPGSSIYSTSANGGVQSGNGTSYASPIVAGVAAALKQYDSTFDARAFRYLIKHTSKKLVDSTAFPYDSSGYSKSFGYGQIAPDAIFNFIEDSTTFRLVLDPAGGQISEANLPEPYVTAGALAKGVSLPGSTKISKSGYVFDGWFAQGQTSKVDILSASSAGLASNGMICLTAKWRDPNAPVIPEQPGTGDPSSDDDDSDKDDSPSGDDSAGANNPPSDDDDSGKDNPPSDDDDSGKDNPPSDDDDSGKDNPPSDDDDSGKDESSSDDDDSDKDNPPSDDDDSDKDKLPSGDDDSNKAESPADEEDQSNENPADDEKTPVEQISLRGAPDTFAYKASGVDNILKLTVLVAPADATDKEVVWSSSNAGFATVDKDGRVAFKDAEGVVQITATAKDGSGVKAVKFIKVVRNVTAIRTPLTSYYIQKGKKLTLPLVLSDATAPTQTITSKLTFRSSNTRALTVDAKGVMQASKVTKKKTAVDVTVTAANGKSRIIRVYVTPTASILKKFTVTGVPKKLYIGQTAQLKIKLKTKAATNLKIAFKSSKPSVLSVDKAGKLTAKKKGNATITVKISGKAVMTKKITVA